MKRKRNTTQMKEQTRSTGVQINEEEVGKLSEKVKQRRKMSEEILNSKISK